jgi:FlaG/FlaF family flagellin (archaellin)
MICSGLLPDHCSHTCDLSTDVAEDVSNIQCTTKFTPINIMVMTINISISKNAPVELPKNLADWLSRIADKVKFLRYTHTTTDKNINNKNRAIIV